MTKVGIGMRSLKTGLAVFICLALYSYIPLTEPILAVIAAVMSIQSNIDDSVANSKNRLIGTVLGTLIGVIYIQIPGDSLISIAVGVILLIALLNKLNQRQSIGIAMVLFVNIITGVVQGNVIIYGLYRFANTLVGIMVGFLINYFIKPPNQIENIKRHVIQIVDEIECIVQGLIFSEQDIDLKVFKAELQDIEMSLKIYNQDKKYHMAVMDKIKYVEQSILSYNKLYSHLLLVKDKKGVLTNENIGYCQKVFGKEYEPQENIKIDESYTLIYNYHIHEMLQIVVNIRKNLENVSRGRAVKQNIWYKKRKIRGNKNG